MVMGMCSAKRSLYPGWSPDAQRTSTPDPSHERRGAHRIAIDADASFVDEGDSSPIHARVVSLSTTGAFLVLDRLYGLGNILKVTIKISDGANVSATAIVRTRLRGRGNGVEFLMVAPDDRQAIELLTERPIGGYKARVYQHW